MQLPPPPLPEPVRGSRHFCNSCHLYVPEVLVDVPGDEADDAPGRRLCDLCSRAVFVVTGLDDNELRPDEAYLIRVLLECILDIIEGARQYQGLH